MARNFVYSTEFGTSADVVPKILQLYVIPGSVIADLTYDKGVLWRKVTGYTIVGSDIRPVAQVVTDARQTCYGDESFDCAILDPPYGNASTAPRKDAISKRYSLPILMAPAKIKQFYFDAIPEGCRILKRRGVLIVKCQNFVDGGKSHWMEELIFNHATGLGFRAEGKINMVPSTKPLIRHKDTPQRHERKNHSVFWIFKKMRD